MYKTKHKIITTFLAILVITFFLGCEDCKEDVRLKEKIEEKIEIIQQRFNYSRGDDINYRSAEDMFRAMGYLGFLTGYMADNPYNYRQTYTDTMSLYTDFKIWRDWYEENKCGLTLEEADSIVHYNGSVK